MGIAVPTTESRPSRAVDDADLHPGLDPAMEGGARAHASIGEDRPAGEDRCGERHGGRDARAHLSFVAHAKHDDACVRNGDDEPRLVPEAGAAELMATLDAEADGEHDVAVEG
jgi:hypothetical protein